jgi:hypothetical protein
MNPVADNPVIVPDRELDEERKPGGPPAHPLRKASQVLAGFAKLGIAQRFR